MFSSDSERVCRLAIHRCWDQRVLNLLDTTCKSFCRSYCFDCVPAGIATPTLGTAECRLTGRLGVQSDLIDNATA